jgi:hypothetical protein
MPVMTSITCLSLLSCIPILVCLTFIYDSLGTYSSVTSMLVVTNPGSVDHSYLPGFFLSSLMTTPGSEMAGSRPYLQQEVE